MLMLARSSEEIPTSCFLLVLDALPKNITPTFLIDLSSLQSCSSPSPTPSPTCIGTFFHISTVTVITAPFRSMLAPEHPSPLQSSQICVLLLALHGSPPFFFSRKEHSENQKSRSHVTRVRIVRVTMNDCPSEPPAWKEVSSCAWSASMLKQRHCKRKRSDTRQDRTHRRSHAAFARFAALDFASTCKNWAVSSDHIPPSARPSPDNPG